jgi:hypothetical protein
MTSAHRQAMITEFVKGTLGCQCPDRVFDKIETGSMAATGMAAEATRIVVGDTLLVYIVAPVSAAELSANLVELAELGRRDRDTNRYNRFRLVVADVADSRERERATASFTRASGADDKMHIHFVHPETVHGFLSHP